MTNKILHPGRFFKEKVMKPYGLTVEELAENLNLTPSVINNFLNGRRGITAQLAVSLDIAFPDVQMTAEDWMGLQQLHSIAFMKDRRNFEHIIPYRKPGFREDDIEHEI